MLRTAVRLTISNVFMTFAWKVITLVVFVAFVRWYLDEPIRWNIVAGFAFVALGASLVLAPWKPAPTSVSPPPADAPPAVGLAR